MIFNPSFLQSDIWGSFRETQGWLAHRANGILVLERPVPFGRSLLYSPEVTAKPEILLDLLPSIKDIAERRKSIVYRLELLVDKQEELAERWRVAMGYSGFVPGFETIQPADRHIVRLSDDAAMLANMKQKGRYNIRIAEKNGVLVRESTAKSLKGDIEIFYSLMKQTSKRENFQTRSQKYFQDLAETLYRHNCGRVFVATYQNQPLAASIITHYEGLAGYLYGASSREHKDVMAPYAMHWAAMQWATSQNANAYDLLAISPQTSNEPGKTTVRKHKFDGITRFKQQFGGEDIRLLGTWDLVLNPSWYTAFKTGQRIRR